MRRNILKPAPKPPADARRLAALKAHLTRAEAALRRWTRRLKRAMTEVQKHQAAVERYTKKLAKETPP